MSVCPPEGTLLVDTDNMCCVLSAGLLGAKLDMAAWDAGGSSYIRDVRIEEAERRILELEAQVRELVALVQP